MKGYARKSFSVLLNSGCITPVSDTISGVSIYRFTPPDDILLDVEYSQEQSLDYLQDFCTLASDLGLPINSPFAFYHELKSKADCLAEDAELKEKTRKVLKLAYQDYKFLFGSSFEDTDWQRSGFRLADWTAFFHKENSDVTPELHKLLDSAAHMQNQLSGAVYFTENFPYCEDQFSELESKAAAYKNWLVASASNSSRKNRKLFFLGRLEITVLCQVYSEFYLRQQKRSLVQYPPALPESNKPEQYPQPDNLKQIQMIRNFPVCIQTAVDIVKIIYHLQEILHRMQTKQADSNSTCFVRYKHWRSELFHYFSSHKTEIWQMDHSCPEEEVELRNILKEYDDDPAKITPSDMEDCISELMAHPLIRSIYSIADELCKQHVQVIAPYYLFTILKHKSEDIFAPFRKKSYKWSNSKVKTEYEVMSTDETSAKKQRNSIFLFNALCSLAGMFMSFNNSNIKLCEFLFERCRGYVPHCRIEPMFYRSCKGETCNIELNTIVKSSLHQYPLQFSIAHNIRNTSQINVMNFQQYAQTQCTAEDFYHFFFHPNSAQNKVLKRLKELLTKEKVDEYAAIALYPADGYGTSHQTVKWHCQMAAFMDQIIDSDIVLADYVDGASLNESDWEKINIGDGFMNFAVWRESITYGDPADPDSDKKEENKPQVIQYITNHAQIQLAIHKICTEQITEKTVETALYLYKKFFFEWA